MTAMLMDHQDPLQPAADGATPEPAPHVSGRLPSTALLQGARVVEIDHHGVVYKLQATRQGKLILTK